MKRTLHTAAIISILGCSAPATELELQDGGAPDAGVITEIVEAPQPEPDAGPPPVATIQVSDMLRQMDNTAAQRERQRPTMWEIPTDPDELRRVTMEALLRVGVSEEGWANPGGIKAIWQTTSPARGCMLNETTAMGCRDPRLPEQPDRGPPVVGLYRHSRYATGTVPPNTQRQRWTSTLTLDCEQPSGWPTHASDGSDYAEWRSYRDLCEALVVAIGEIVDGTDNIQACPPDSRPIAWGCDPTRRRAQREILGLRRSTHGCNDTPIAMRRRLVRLDCGETENAYYTRPGYPHAGTLPASERRLHALEAQNLENESPISP